MSDYHDLVKDEAKSFFEAAWPEFQEDEEEFGGSSESPNLSRWIDRTGKLSARVEEISSKWRHKDILWVENNTKNRNPHGGGDRHSNAFASFLKDLRHEIKKIAKKQSS